MSKSISKLMEYQVTLLGRSIPVLALVVIVLVACCGCCGIVSILPTPAAVDVSITPTKISPTSTSEPTNTYASTDAPEPTETLAPTNTPEPTEPSTSIPVSTYQIVEVEDISVARAVRFRVKATTDFPISIEQINGLCEQVVEDLKSQESLNAVVVFLYDTRSLWSDAYSIAKCEYAPSGVWEDAVNVQTGDYSTHRFTYEYMPKVDDPQAALSDRPSEQEFNLCQQWNELSSELLSESGDVDATAAETIAYERIANDNGISVQAVEDAVFKCIVWSWR